MRFRGLVALAVLGGLAAGSVLAGGTGVDAGLQVRDKSGQAGSVDAIPRRVDRQALMATVVRLASPGLAGRLTGSAGGRQAREILVRAFADSGLDPAGTEGFLQPFPVSPLGRDGLVAAVAGAGTAPLDAANVVGRLEGREAGLPVIILSAHYDHLGSPGGTVYPGADDNASGVALLVEIARILRAAPPRHSMILAAFDGEELGLLGARAFVAEPRVMPKSVALDINLDMVSRSSRRELYVAGTSYTPELRPPLEAVARRARIHLLFGHDRKDGPQDDWTDESDHGAFHDRGIPFVYFGVEDHEDYHEPTDTADRIDPGFFGDAADTIVEAVYALDRAVDLD
jgi:Peptidase family M28